MKAWISWICSCVNRSWYITWKDDKCFSFIHWYLFYAALTPLKTPGFEKQIPPTPAPSNREKEQVVFWGFFFFKRSQSHPLGYYWVTRPWLMNSLRDSCVTNMFSVLHPFPGTWCSFVSDCCFSRERRKSYVSRGLRNALTRGHKS